MSPYAVGSLGMGWRGCGGPERLCARHPGLRVFSADVGLDRCSSVNRAYDFCRSPRCVLPFTVIIGILAFMPEITRELDKLAQMVVSR
jgi:hypothetical protein